MGGTKVFVSHSHRRYHRIYRYFILCLHRLELAGLIEVGEDGAITLTESGEAYGALVKSQAERGGAG